MKMWEPSAAAVEQSQVTQFIKRLESKLGISFAGFHDFYDWTVREPESFWAEIWSFCEIKAAVPYEQVLSDADKMPGAKWFPGARLNFAENLLRFRDDHDAIVAWNEFGRHRVMSYRELYEQVARLSDALRNFGIKPGDKVAAYIPNIPEAMVCMLAVTAVGGVWSSCSPDFSVQGVLDRFSQISPRVLITADACFYKGEQRDCLQKVSKICAKLPTVEKVLIVPYVSRQPAISSVANATLLNDFIGEDQRRVAESEREIEFEQLPPDHPVYVLYSSGTTGPPKCIVHGAIGMLAEHFKEHSLDTDLRRDDKFFYATTCGWMMWNCSAQRF